MSLLMPEKEPQVTFTDRRKISSDGEIRPEAAAKNEEERQAARQREAANEVKPPASPVVQAGNTEAQQPISTPGGEKMNGELPEYADSQDEDSQDEGSQGPTAQETAESHAAYRETTQQLDEMLRAKAPDSQHLGPVAFEHLVQSMYMTAMMALGAGTQPGEKPRIDLMGARQTIDLLNVLQEKSKGNLTADEQRLLESALFELRMMFLEITNAIARNAENPAKPPQPGRK